MVYLFFIYLYLFTFNISVYFFRDLNEIYSINAITEKIIHSTEIEIYPILQNDLKISKRVKPTNRPNKPVYSLKNIVRIEKELFDFSYHVIDGIIIGVLLDHILYRLPNLSNK